MYLITMRPNRYNVSLYVLEDTSAAIGDFIHLQKVQVQVLLTCNCMFTCGLYFDEYIDELKMSIDGWTDKQRMISH